MSIEPHALAIGRLTREARNLRQKAEALGHADGPLLEQARNLEDSVRCLINAQQHRLTTQAVWVQRVRVNRSERAQEQEKRRLRGW